MMEAELPNAIAPPAPITPLALFEVIVSLVSKPPPTAKSAPPAPWPELVTLLPVNLSPVETSVPLTTAMPPPPAVLPAVFRTAAFDVNVLLLERTVLVPATTAPPMASVATALCAVALFDANVFPLILTTDPTYSAPPPPVALAAPPEPVANAEFDVNVQPVTIALSPPSAPPAAISPPVAELPVNVLLVNVAIVPLRTAPAMA